MALFKATKDGNVLMTPQEEAEILAERAEHDSLPNKKKRLRQKANDEKIKYDSRAVTVNGKSYSLSFSLRMELSNAYIFLLRNTTLTAPIETKDGETVDLDLAGIEAVFDGVNNYVSSVSNARKQHFENIKNLNNNNIDAYDIKTLWP